MGQFYNQENWQVIKMGFKPSQSSIGDGTVEADGFYSCAKCLVPEMALEMERLFQGQDYSESLDLLFQPFHDTLRAAFLCNRCALTCLL